MSFDSPNPELIGDLFWGIFKPQFICLALEIDIFTPLAKSPANAETVALACHSRPPGIQALLDYFCGLHILDKDGSYYSLTPTAEAFLLPASKAYVGDMILHYTGQRLFEQIETSIQSGNPQCLGENFVQDAWLESFSSWRISESLRMWKDAGVAPDQDLEVRLIDLACGCGIKSMALAQSNPAVKITCVDSPEVLQVANDLAKRFQIEDRVTFIPGDILTAKFGERQYRAALLGQITHYLTEAENRELFKRVFLTLEQRGRLVIDCPMSTENPAEHASLLTLFLWANSGGKAYSFSTYEEWLLASGFREVKQLSERWLCAVK